MKNILFSVTPTGWAYDLRCQALMKCLSSLYHIEKQDNEYLIKHGMEYDLVYASGFDTVAKAGIKYKCICTTIGGVVERSIDEIVKIVSPATAVAIPNLKWFRELNKRNLKFKLFYISNGVDTKAFIPRESSSSEFTVGWVGNDRSDRAVVKRINELRQVCSFLQIPMLERNWLHRNVSHKFMPDFYKKIDLYVNCSITEGSSNPILEACSAGVPVLATNVGNVPELISSGVVPLKDDLSDLEEKILFFKNMSEEERKRIGRKLRHRMILEFDWSKRALEYKAMFDYCLLIGSLLDEGE